METGEQRLDGWKDIAAFLGRSVRTVQRWETFHRLPIRRVAGQVESVYALTGELEEWRRNGGSAQMMEPDSDAEGEGFRFLGNGRDGKRRRKRLLLIVAAAVLLLSIAIPVLTAFVLRRDVVESGNETFDSKPLPLNWETIGGSRKQQRLADGNLLDPAYVTIEPGALVFEYEKFKQRMQDNHRPLAFAALNSHLSAPYVSFSYVPHSDARVTHTVGFAVVDRSALPAVYARQIQEDSRSWLLEMNGVGLELGRTHIHYTNSTLTLVRFENGKATPIGTRMLPFQFDPGKKYFCTLTIIGTSVTGTVTDGHRVEEVTASMPSVAPEPNTVFVSDGQDGLSYSAPPGRFAMRFQALDVRDAIYKLNAVMYAPAGGSISTGAKTLSVAIYRGTANIVDEGSIRLNGVPVKEDNTPTGRSGLAIKHVDLNNDNIRELICVFDVAPLHLQPGSVSLTLEANGNIDGRRYRGHLTAHVVK